MISQDLKAHLVIHLIIVLPVYNPRVKLVMVVFHSKKSDMFYGMLCYSYFFQYADKKNWPMTLF